MKKWNTLLLAGLLLTSGCASNQEPVSIRISFRDSTCQLSSEDAGTLQTLLKEIMDEDLQALREDEHYIGGFAHTFRIDENDETSSYSFMADTLSVTDPDKTLHEYKLDEQLYKKTVYPALSEIIENYLPLTYQLNSPLGIVLKVNGSEEVNEESLFLFINEMFQSALQWTEADIYEGSYEDELACIDFSDTIITENIHLFNDFMVIREHILTYTDPAFPESFLNSMHS